MTNQAKSRQAAAHIETAIQASCGALITLELIGARAGDRATDDVRYPVQQAIESLRLAIAELGAVTGPGRVIPGFVLRAGVPGPT